LSKKGKDKIAGLRSFSASRLGITASIKAVPIIGDDTTLNMSGWDANNIKILS